MPSLAETVALTLGMVATFAAFIWYEGLWWPRWLNDGWTPAQKRRLRIGIIDGDWFSLSGASISREPNEGYECRGRFQGRWFAIKPVACPDGNRSLSVDIDEYEERAIVNEAMQYMGAGALSYQTKYINDLRAKWIADLHAHLPLRPPFS